MVAALPVIAIGIFVVLFYFLFTSPAWREASRAVVTSIPLIGGWLGTNLAALYASLLYQVNRQAVGELSVLSRTLQWVADSLSFNYREQSAFAQATATALYKLRYQTLPQAQRQAEAYAAAKALNASNYALGLARLAVRYGQTLYSSGIAYTRTSSAALAAWTGAGLARAQGYAQALAGAGLAYSNRLYLAAVARADAEAVAQGRYAQAVGQTVAEYARGLFAVAVGHADQEFGIAEGYARKLAGDQAAYTDLRTGQAVSAAALAVGVVATAVRAIERSPCMQQCDTLGNLGAELSVLDLGAILALVEMAASDPRATAAFLQDEVAPLVRSNAAMIRGLV